MIRFDGYYLTEPLESYNGRVSANKSSYHFSAYLFNENGFVKIKSRHEIPSALRDFTEDDFEKNCSIKQFVLSQNKICIKSNNRFQKDYDLVLHSNKEFVEQSTNRNGVFIPWKNIASLSQKDINEAKLINELFGPFYHKKFKTFFE